MSISKYLQSADGYFNLITTHLVLVSAVGESIGSDTDEQLKFNLIIKLVQFDGTLVRFHCNKAE